MAGGLRAAVLGRGWYALGGWPYNDRMPPIPSLGVGAVPLVQLAPLLLVRHSGLSPAARQLSGGP